MNSLRWILNEEKPAKLLETWLLPIVPGPSLRTLWAPWPPVPWLTTLVANQVLLLTSCSCSSSSSSWGFDGWISVNWFGWWWSYLVIQELLLLNLMAVTQSLLWILTSRGTVLCPVALLLAPVAKLTPSLPPTIFGTCPTKVPWKATPGHRIICIFQNSKLGQSWLGAISMQDLVDIMFDFFDGCFIYSATKWCSIDHAILCGKFGFTCNTWLEMKK